MVRVVATVLRHPGLWPTALRQVRRTAGRRWWRRPPFLPLPPPDYVRFRLVTQYGSESAVPETGDVVNYLRWCRDWDRARVAP